MFKNYLKIAFRNIAKRFSFTLINISGFAIGITSSILILLWVSHEMNYDNFHENVDRIFRVVTELVQGENSRYLATTPAPTTPALLEKFPEIESYTRVYVHGTKLVNYNEKRFLESRFLFADLKFFNMFSFPVLNGSLDNNEDGFDYVILTREMSQKYFGQENPIGKVLNIDGLGDLKISAVLENVPESSHLQFDFVAPFELLKRLNEPIDGWGRFRYYSYILLKKDVKYTEIRDKILTFFEDSEIQIPAKLHIQPLPGIYFDSRFGVDMVSHGNKNNVYIILSIAFLILLIACINYMNLATAQASKRAKEVGLRKVAGAKRSDIIKQYYGESILLTFIAFFISLVLAELLIMPYNNLIGMELDLNVFGNEGFMIGIFVLVIIIGLIAGSYPALFLSSFNPAGIIKGAINGAPSKALLRKILVVTQFTMSIAMIIAALIVYNQLDYIKNKSLGFEKEHIIYIPIRGDIGKKFEMVKAEMLQNPLIESVTAANALPHRIGSMTSGISWEGKDPESRELFGFASVDFDFINTLNIQLLEGRNFSKEFTTDLGEAFVINEQAAKSLGFDSPIGKKVVFHGQNAQIIGVVQNFHFRSLYNPIEPVFLGVLPERYEFFNIFVKTKSADISSTVKYIESVWNKFNSEYPFNYFFLDESIESVYKPLEQLREIFIYFAAIAIILSCLGLYGLASFMVDQRVKEVGIRKVLGASISGITFLLSKEFTKWVLISNLFAWPIAWFAMDNWLQNFAYRIDFSTGPFLLAGLAALVIALITVSWQATKAALANPVKALRYE